MKTFIAALILATIASLPFLGIIIPTFVFGDAPRKRQVAIDYPSTYSCDGKSGGNIAVGYKAGLYLLTECGNILIGNDTNGIAGRDNFVNIQNKFCFDRITGEKLNCPPHVGGWPMKVFIEKYISLKWVLIGFVLTSLGSKSYPYAYQKWHTYLYEQEYLARKLPDYFPHNYCLGADCFNGLAKLHAKKE